jgi:hypothetical protein
MIALSEINKGDIVSATIGNIVIQGCVISTCGAGCCVRLELPHKNPILTKTDSYETDWMMAPKFTSRPANNIQISKVLKYGHYDRCPQCFRLMCGLDNEV